MTIKTLGLASLGTGALVTIHHQYRKRHHAQAQLQDYVVGVKAQLQRLHHANTQAINSAQQTWLAAWQAADSNTNSKPHQSCQHSSNCQDSDSQSNRQSKQTAQASTVDIATNNAIHHTKAETVAWVSGVGDLSKGEFAVVGIADNAAKDILWQTPMPERVHDIVVQPVGIHKATTTINTATTATKLAVDTHQHVVVMGRRPSEHFWVLAVATGEVIYRIKAACQRHFYGHACFSLDGQTLYVTENDTVSLTGKIGVYAVNQQYKKIAEFATHGIGPHELLAHPDGETLVIANGGIKTEKASREELNLDSMQPSLVYLNRHDGRLLEQIYPEHNQMSVRHLSLHPDGLVAIGIQFQGERHLNVPLVLTHRRGEEAFTALSMPQGQWQQFHHYIASVAINAKTNLLCASSPIGGCAAVYDLQSGQMIQSAKLPDCAGVAVALTQDNQSQCQADTNTLQTQGFIVSDGQGNLTQFTVNSDFIEHGGKVANSNKVASDKQEQANNAVKPLHVTQVRHALAFDNHLQAVAYPALFYAAVTALTVNIEHNC